MLAIILNGPIGSGKDAIADLLAERFNRVNKLQFKDALYRESYLWLSGRLAAFCGVFVPDLTTWVGLCTKRETKEVKCLPLGIAFSLESNPKDFGHKMWSPRMVLQHVSENVVKPMKGADAFGEMAVKELKDGFFNIFSDGGFIDEIEVIAQCCPTLVVNLYREGCSFEGDSRSYVTNSSAVTVKVVNDGSLDQAASRILSMAIAVHK
jgi:hypothetical protein